MRMLKEKFVKNKHRKGYEDIFNTSWVTAMQTFEKTWKKVLCFFPNFELSLLANTATQIAKVKRFY